MYILIVIIENYWFNCKNIFWADLADVVVADTPQTQEFVYMQYTFILQFTFSHNLVIHDFFLCFGQIPGRSKMLFILEL